MKILRTIFLVIWTMHFVIGIAMNCSQYKLGELIALIVVALIPYLIWFLCARKRKKKSTSAPSNNKPIEETEVLHAQYLESNNGTTCRTDGNQISDEEVPYLIQASYESALNYEKTSPNPKYHRTAKEEELDFQFFMKYGAIVDSLSDQFMELYRTAHKTDDLTERIHLLEQATIAFEKAKKFCYSKGKGGTIYFQDMWEHMSNSQNDCFSYLDNITNSINEAKRIRDIVIPGVLGIIHKYDGILQKEIYAFLPEISKSEIQSVIRDLESNGSITRAKKSNSYELHINEV